MLQMFGKIAHRLTLLKGSNSSQLKLTGLSDDSQGITPTRGDFRKRFRSSHSGRETMAHPPGTGSA
ncbi:hypothetical protein O159_00100 [Leifsonia xyli subsp. cynodontis DSM 46306]|uniref:Uncharacterized protein n=1 Tax=Leifsonia xyli subsp. cynodontis DSM 46306 TaxID=1389489 RepID=U3P4D9_LEIXC|nr:hypothetical protein O159_00100 [Leifsonia xyli subsp. cynodontis DSM 46306]